MRSQTGRGAFAWAMLVPSLALAQTAPSARVGGAMALRWHDPNGLAATSETDFEARLSERLGRPAFDAGETRHALAVTWLGSPEQCQVELQLLQGVRVDGTRLLKSPGGDCRSLVPALLTVSALLIESHLEAEPEPEPEPGLRPEPEPTPLPPPREKPPAAPQEPQSEPRLLLSAGAVLTQGLAPRLEFGPAVSVVVAPLRRVRLGVLGSLFLPHQYGASPGLALEHDSVALVACGMPLTGTLALGLCGNGGLHRWRSEGISLPHPETQRTVAWTVGLSLRGEWQLVRHLWWVGHLGGDVTTEPLYFYFTPAPGGQSELYRQQRIAPSLFLGLTLELP